MFHLTIRIKMSPREQENAFVVLRSLAERTRVLPGCAVCRIYQDVQEEGALLFEEIWSSEDAMNRHIRSEGYRDVLLIMEMAHAKPEIRLETISNLTGMETLEKLREEANPNLKSA